MGWFTLDPIKPDNDNIEKMRQEIREGSYKNTNKEITFKLDQKIIDKLKKYSLVNGINTNDTLEEIISEIYEINDIEKKFKQKFKNEDILNSSIDLSISNGISSSDDTTYSDNTIYSNPSTGLSMSNGIGGVDVSGNAYGT